MRALQGEVLLSAWERADRAVEPLRAVVLLHVASPGDDMRGLTELPLAERNRRLLELRTLSFGTQMESFAECPQCGAELEFTLDADELAAEMQAAVPLGWSEEGRACVMRPVNTADLLECMRAADEAAAGALLLARSIDGAEWQGEELMEHFEAVNRSAEIRLELRCAECGAASTLDLDIARFLYTEARVAARRLLADVDRLARAYGWSERAITRMSAMRRAAYLAGLDR